MMKVIYKKGLRTETRHESGAILITDAPKELKGKGEYFSPTDLLALSLASCIITLMGIAADKLGFELTDLSAEVSKAMTSTSPRRLAKIDVVLRSSTTPTPEAKEKMERAALTCPVHESLHPDIKQNISFHWGS